MLHKIDTDHLRIGMYVQSLDCSWLSSPFWRRRFVIANDDDIASLREAGIAQVTIDDAKGIGISRAANDTQAGEGEPAPDRPAAVAKAVPHRPRRRPAPAGSEVDRARETIERSRLEVTRMFGEARLGHAVQAEVVGPLVDEIAASVARDASAMLKVTRLKHKNEYTYLHSVAVCALMINLARQLGMPEADSKRVGMAGLLHDIGKMSVPDAILDKPGALDDAEFARIRQHPERGHKLLTESADIDALALDVCLHHHERIDGRGYPYGKKADEISIYARMGAICDVYDAVTSNRPYKDAWSPNEALARMRSWEGHFDPEILEAFIESIGIPPLHSLVRLASNRLALVIGDGTDPTTPAVRAFFSIPDQAFLDCEDFETGTGGEEILKMERANYWFGSAWPDVFEDVAAGRVHTGSGFTPARPYVAITDRVSQTRILLGSRRAGGTTQ